MQELDRHDYLICEGQTGTKKGKERLLYSKRQNSAVKPEGLAMNETQHDLVFFGGFFGENSRRA